MKGKFLLLSNFFIIAMMLFLASCMESGGKIKTIDGPFTVIWDRGAGPSFETHFANHLSAKYPEAAFEQTFIIREFRYLGGGRDAMHPLDGYDIAEKDLPGDIIMFESTLAPYLFKSGYLEPLDPYLDTILGIMGRIDSRALDFVKALGGGRTYGIPFGKDVYALYYNTTLFDELGLPYPTDGMTWDDVFGLAREIMNHPQMGTRAGLALSDMTLPFSQFHLRFFDEFGMPDDDSPLWARALEFKKTFNELYEQKGMSFYIYEHPFGFSDGQAAMYAGHYLGDINPSGFRDRPFTPPYKGDWDLVSFPVFEDAPDTGPLADYYLLGIPRNSQKKPEAFQLIAHLLSDEVQLANSRLGVASILSDPFWIESFGADLSHFHGKRVRSFFHHPEEGSLDLDFDWQMQRAGYRLLEEERGWMMDYLNYRREKLEKVGVVEGAHLER